MDTQDTTVEAGRAPLVSRRTVAIGAAWSVPVIIAATAAPAAAASAVAALAATGTLVKTTGQNYTLTLFFDLPAGSSDLITVTSVVADSGKTRSTFGPVPASKTVTTASPDAVFALSRNGQNSATTAVVTYTVNGGLPQQLTVAITGV
jgi:hypothetical protein